MIARTHGFVDRGAHAERTPFGTSAERTPIPTVYRVHLGERHFQTGKITVVPFHRFCQDLHLP